MRWFLVFAALIVLHQPDGKPIFVNPEEIIVVAPAGNIGRGNAKLMLHDTWLFVLETPAQVKCARDGG